VVTFGTAGSVGGSFSPTTCTLSSAGTCTTTYTPSGTLAAGSYSSDITARFTANNNYAAASGSSTLTITAVAPTVATVSAVSSAYGSTTGITVTATESGSAGVVTGGVVTFGTAGSVGGSFSPTTCTLSSAGTCTTTYTPSGTLAAGSYSSDITARFTANNNYAAASGSSSLIVGKATATVTLGSLTPTYTGSALAATATTNPTGLTVNFTYNGSSTAPTTAGSYTVVGTINDPNYQGSSTGTLVIGNATLTISANNASRVYGTANPTFSGSVTGQRNGDTFTESFSTSATITSPVSTYSIVPAATGTNLSDYTQSIVDGTLTVTQAGTTTALTLSSGSVTPGQSVTLTAQVASSTTGTPTGTVSFYDNSSLLNAATLNGGTASYSTTSLAAGITHTITAVYSGDTNFTTSSSSTTSTTVTVAPLDFTMTIVGPSIATVVPGSSITYQVTLTPDYGAYAGPVSFAVSGLPPGATVSFSPSSIAANAGPQTITVTIQTAPATAAAHAPQRPSSGSRVAPFALAFLLLFSAGGMRQRGRNLKRMVCVAVMLVGGAATLMLSGCSNANGFFTQTAQNYTVTVTASSGNMQHTVAVTLNVQ
jgi:hypothetical protein